MAEAAFRLATVEDIPALMAFMETHWRAGHVLARRADMWAWEFGFNTRFADGLNVGLAFMGDELAGIFGWMPYSAQPVPDMAGSLWKVTDAAQKRVPMLGLKLRKFVMDQVQHRFFAAPGAGPQTRPIYGLLGMQWHRMRHFYRLNPAAAPYQLAQVKSTSSSLELSASLPVIVPVRSPDALMALPFDQWTHLWPQKDAAYMRWRFWDYPFADYQLWRVEQDGRISHLLVTRRQCHQQRCALRVVDVLGEDAGLGEALMALFEQAVMPDPACEYLDLICHGVQETAKLGVYMDEVEFDRDSGALIPNYFEPFELRKVPVYCVADQVPTGVQYRQFKADGDQDRPNLLEHV